MSPLRNVLTVKDKVVKKRKTKKVSTKQSKIETSHESNNNANHMKIELQQMRSTIGESVIKSIGINCCKLLGAHVSAAGGLEQSIYNASAIGCRSFALFLRNQRQWNARPMTDETVKNFQRALQECNYRPEHIVPHGSYLLNLGSPIAANIEKTRETLIDEIDRCQRLGIRLYNFHPGSTVGKCTREECLKTVADTINYVIDKTTDVILVIETMCGAGNTVGGTFDEIRCIIDGVENKHRVGVCIDTCHIFAAGYDIRTETAYMQTMNEFERIVGFEYLKAVHLNDSNGDLNSHLDRHANIGKGRISNAAFALLMNDKRFDNIPMILETPEEDYPNEMRLLYSMYS